MISRKSALILGEAYQKLFRMYYRTQSGMSYKNDTEALYDFLYARNYEVWFCNISKSLKAFNSKREIKDFIMKLHTGETQYGATVNWDWKKREELGQKYLENLATDLLLTKSHEQLTNSLELDGYRFNQGKLLKFEDEFLNIEEEMGVLESLYSSLELDNLSLAVHHLNLSSDQYIEGKWDDSISNSRKYLETCLREVANKYNQMLYGEKLTRSTFEKPVLVRDYLEREELLEMKEKKSIASVYGLLSNTGSHPYIAEKEQARLLRNLALTFSQFVLLRFEGWIVTRYSLEK